MVRMVLLMFLLSRRRRQRRRKLRKRYRLLRIDKGHHHCLPATPRPASRQNTVLFAVLERGRRKEPKKHPSWIWRLRSLDSSMVFIAFCLKAWGCLGFLQFGVGSRAWDFEVPRHAV